MNHDPVIEQAGELSAKEHDFATRRMPVARTVEIIEAEYDVLDARQADLMLRGADASDVLQQKMNLLDEWDCLLECAEYTPD